MSELDLTEELWAAVQEYSAYHGNNPVGVVTQGARIIDLVRRKRDAERKPRFYTWPEPLGAGFWAVYDEREGKVASGLRESMARWLVEALSEKEGRWL